MPLENYGSTLQPLKKMDKSTTFYIYDVVEESVKKFVEAGEDKVKACSSSKEVADKSVCEQMISRP